MENKKTGGPAYPVTETNHDVQIAPTEFGVTELDYFASRVNVSFQDIITILSGNGIDIESITVNEFVKIRAEIKFAEAAAMLKEREKYE